MAADPHNMLRADPAIIKWQKMTANRHKYFRFNRRTAFITFMYVAFVPSIIGILAYRTEGKWDLRGKRKGDLLSEY